MEAKDWAGHPRSQKNRVPVGGPGLQAVTTTGGATGLEFPVAKGEPSGGECDSKIDGGVMLAASWELAESQRELDVGDDGEDEDRSDCREP